MDKWWKYLNETEPYQQKARRGHSKGKKRLTQTGKQRKGGSPFDKATSTSRSRSAPPGFGALGEEVEPESFEKQPSLEPKIWQNKRLNKNVSKRLIKIAREFLEGLDIGATMEDLRFTGSLANYNWSKYSDIDLHVLVDFSKIDENTELVKSFFDGARVRWNDQHDIRIYGHEVEIYVENIAEDHRSAGVYSITLGEWVVSPDPAAVDFDYSTARKKADAIETEVNLIDKFAVEKPRAALKSIDRLKKKIRIMRRAGLHSPLQEYSAENIAFKILRREEILDKLNNMKYDAYDRVLSIGE